MTRSKRHRPSPRFALMSRMAPEPFDVSASRRRPQAPFGSNQAWSWDFMFDRCANGQRSSTWSSPTSSSGESLVVVCGLPTSARNRVAARAHFVLPNQRFAVAHAKDAARKVRDVRSHSDFAIPAARHVNSSLFRIARRWFWWWDAMLLSRADQRGGANARCRE